MISAVLSAHLSMEFLSHSGRKGTKLLIPLLWEKVIFWQIKVEKTEKKPNPETKSNFALLERFI